MATLAIVIGCSEAYAQPVPAPSPPAITQIRGGVYQIRAGEERSVFIVTPEGIVLAEPNGNRKPRRVW